jgi:hypothetical protein
VLALTGLSNDRYGAGGCGEFESPTAHSVGQRFSSQLVHEDFRMKFMIVLTLFALSLSDASACGKGRPFGRFRERGQAASCSTCQSATVTTHQHAPQAAPVVRFISAEPVRVGPSCANGQCPR